MKRICIVISFTLAIILLVTACVSFPYKKPYGKWQSADPDLVIDLDPNIEGPLPGTYVKDGKSYDAEVHFAHEKAIDIVIKDLYVENANSNTYFYGKFKIKDGKLIYTLKPSWQEKTGYKVIEFELIEEYAIP